MLVRLEERETANGVRSHLSASMLAADDPPRMRAVGLAGVYVKRGVDVQEAADRIVKGMDSAIGRKTVTYDFHRMMEGATLRKCSEFADAIVSHMS